jgi:hypothetical protein
LAVQPAFLLSTCLANPCNTVGARKNFLSEIPSIYHHFETVNGRKINALAQAFFIAQYGAYSRKATAEAALRRHERFRPISFVFAGDFY